MSRLIKNEHALEWVLVRQFCEDRLVELREENDLQLSEYETAAVRGKIELIKELITLDQDEEILIQSQTSGYIE